MKERKSFSELWDDYEHAIHLIQKYIEQNNVYVTPKRRKFGRGPKRNPNEIQMDNIPFDDEPSRQLIKIEKPIKDTNNIILFNDET